MVESVILASYSFFGNGAIGDMLATWEQEGFFAYILPFLLIFALVFGILNQIKLFKDSKGINGIIALVVGLMALQFELVPQFFAEIFPRMGVGLAILLVLLILAGLFIDPEKGALMYTLLGIGTIIAIIVFVQTAGALGWPAGNWWYDNWQAVAGVVFILIIVGIIVGSSNKSTTPYKGFWPGQ
ncbi:MAG: hypothetical protein AABW81_03855 [Nanoarchaeota archaeon]